MSKSQEIKSGISRRGLVGVCVAVTGLCVAGAGLAVMGRTLLADKTPDYRYRLKVEVETPEGLKSGYSVIEVETTRGSAVRHRVRGEAVSVDLGSGRRLFALLSSTQDVDWANNVMFIMAPSGVQRQEDDDIFLLTFANMLAMKEEITLPPYFSHVQAIKDMPALPMLVTFDDMSDPASVKEVNPDDLAASFGEGYRLKRITVQMTDDPVTRKGIEGQLPWLRQHVGSLVKRKDGQFVGEMPLAHQIIPTSFQS